MMNPIFKDLVKQNISNFKSFANEVKRTPLDPNLYIKTIIFVPIVLALSVLFYFIGNKDYKKYLKDHNKFTNNSENEYYLDTTQENNGDYCLITPNKKVYKFFISKNENLASKIIKQYQLNWQESINNLEVMEDIRNAIKEPKSLSQILLILEPFDMSFAKEMMDELKASHEKAILEKTISMPQSLEVKKLRNKI